MVAFPAAQRRLLDSTIAEMRAEKRDWEPHWRDLARYVLPRRYSPLAASNMSPSQSSGRTAEHARNRFILDSTGTLAVRTLASGMLNGVTSPARPWLRLRLKNYDEDEVPQDVKVWLEEVSEIILQTLAESNFYNSIALVYVDVCVFGTAAMLAYEDDEEIVRFYNSSVGEFMLAQSFRQHVNHFARCFSLRVHQIIERWGDENVPRQILAEWKKGGAARQKPHDIYHLIVPNTDPDEFVAKSFTWREVYWIGSSPADEVLEVRGFRERPGVWPRWEITGNDSYGTSPTMEALPDIIQLQHETKRKAQGIDKMIDPPIVADVALSQNAVSFAPGSRTYVPSASTVTAKPVFQLNLPIGELSLDIQQVQQRIRETLHNDLFKMISQLDTVRSATEIDARREEKLVLLGPVLERFENEALDPIVKRVFNILSRRGKLPDPPAGLTGDDIDIVYVSVLSDAQRAVGTASIERFLAFVGELAAVAPEVLEIPDMSEMVRDYGGRLNVPARGIKSRDRVAEEQAQREQQLAMQQGALVGNELTQAAKNLSETEVGGGQNALQAVLP